MLTVMSRQSHLILISALLAAPVLACAMAQGQDNPFGAANPFGAGAVQAAPTNAAGANAAATVELQPLDESINNATRVVVESIRAINPKEARQLCMAIRTMLDLEFANDARFYFDRLVKLNLDEAAQVALFESEGSDFFMRLHGSPLLEPEGKPFARSMFAASRRHATDPAYLAGLISNVGDPSLEIRSSAFLTLRRIGAPGIAALVSSFASETDRERILRMRTALRSMGQESLVPMLGGIRSSHIQVRYESLMGLASLRDADALYSVIAPAYSLDEPEEIREAVQGAIRTTWGSLPESGELAQRAFRRTNDLLYGRSRLQLTAGTSLERSETPFWNWDNDSGQLVQIMVSPTTLSRLVALEVARDLVRLSPSDANYRRIHMLAWLDSAKRLTGPLATLQLVDANAELNSLSPPELDEAMRMAVQVELYPAAAGACDLMPQLPHAADMLVGQQPSGVIRALQSGDRNTQFAATRAVMSIDPDKGFHGSSFVLESLLAISGFGDRSSALVGHGDLTLARDLAVTMSAAGVSAETAETGGELFQLAIKNSNVRYLVISEKIAAPGIQNLVPQLRADWRTRLMPIAIMTDDPNPLRSQRLAQPDPLTIVLPLTTDPRLVQLQLEQLSGLNRETETDAADGLEQSEWALAWLAKISQDRTRYAYYDLAPQQTRLIGLLMHPRYTETIAKILGTIGTPDAQRSLVNYASQTGRPDDLRTLAAKAFGQSIRQNGLLLTTSEIQLQYDRYNSSQNENVETQRVLGSILDQIEHRSSDSKTSADNSE